MNDKAFTILNLRSFVGIFSDYGCENTEKSRYRLQTVTFELS